MAAKADLETIATRLAHDYPNENAGIGIVVTDFRKLLNDSIRSPLLVLLGAVGLVLLIACANLANLLLARGVQRRREIVVRLALGARRSRIIRQLVSETMLIAVTGGVLGVLLAAWSLPLLVGIAPSSFEGVKVSIDLRVLFFSALLTVVTGVFFGIAPALQLSRVNMAPGLNSAARGAVSSDPGAKVRAVFVVCQVAISIVLLVAAGLLLRSFQRLLQTDTGMSAQRLLTMEYRLPRNKYGTPQAQATFHRALATRVAQVPGVESSAIVMALPFSGNFGQIHYVAIGGAPPEKGKEPRAFTNLITPDYFSTIGIPVLRGRAFSDHDDASAPAVAIISRSLAERDFAGQDPVGRTVQLVDSDPTDNGKRLTIVGVVGDAKQIGTRDSDEAEIYLSYFQDPGIFGTLVVRTAVDPMSLAEAIRQAVWSIDKDQPVWKVRTLEFLMHRDLEEDRLLMILMTCFGLVAVILTALGTYGVLSNSVSQRRQEIGIRMALGANVGAVRNLVMRQGMRLVLIGAAIGLVTAAAASRMLASVLYGVSALDIAAYVLGCMVMIGVALVASYLPAHRATRVDPATVLRYE
jgi:putative ABC transport system permease protein